MKNKQILFSICIPTYNRAYHLENLLESIKLANKKKRVYNLFNVCISDNSNKSNLNLIKKYKKFFKIVYKKNKKNIGFSRNLLQAINLSKYNFVWILGDDDLIHPNSLSEVSKILSVYHRTVDFFYLNSANLDFNYLKKYKHPFNTKYLPKKKFLISKFNFIGKIKFYKLINSNISKDILGGMYVALFNKKKFLKGANFLKKEAINDLKIFSHVDNTFPHTKIFSNVFMNSEAYFSKKIFSSNLFGVREWNDYYPLVQSIRLLEILDSYKKNGLGLLRYIYEKNKLLHNYIPDIFKILCSKKKFHLSYIDIVKSLLSSFYYPNALFSILRFLNRKIIKKVIG